LVAVIQVLSRLWAVWGVVYQAPEATTLGSIKLLKVENQQLELSMYTLLFAWGVTEVLRYGFFAVKVSPPFRKEFDSSCY
jgi:very-long-chain (3R)-3-hydroxyacyl-CoA dehydratase